MCSADESGSEEPELFAASCRADYRQPDLPATRAGGADLEAVDRDRQAGAVEVTDTDRTVLLEPAHAGLAPALVVAAAIADPVAAAKAEIEQVHEPPANRACRRRIPPNQ